MSIAALTGYLDLTSGFEWIGTYPALLIFATATVLEIVAYYVPWLDNLLDTVATTMVERERLRRQVQVLSAEGRLSAWILGLLPVAFAGYLVLVRPDYIKPMYETFVGWVMIGFGVLLLVIGSLWLRKVVKVEV